MKIEPTSKQELLDRAEKVLGKERMTALLKMSMKDLYVTYSVAYQQFRDEEKEAVSSLITSRFFTSGNPYKEMTGRIGELRAKNLRNWTREEYDEWFVLWQAVKEQGDD